MKRLFKKLCSGGIASAIAVGLLTAVALGFIFAAVINFLLYYFV